jgi:hypothetical protein
MKGVLAMSDIINEKNITNKQIEDVMLEVEISDESLEAAAFGGNLGGVYTEFAYCTRVACPG